MHAVNDTSVLNFVVRMVVPMRREFGSTLDVQQFLRDTSYAREVVEKARTSQVERLREYAETVDRLLRRQPAAARVPPAAPAPAPEATQAFVAQRREAVRRLLDLVGPSGEPLAIRIERAADAQALGPLLVMAEQMVANLRGTARAREFAEHLAALG